VYHYCDTFMSEHLIAPLVSNDDFILFDSGAAANVCLPASVRIGHFCHLLNRHHR